MEKHNKVKRIIKIVGIVILTIGLALDIIGFGDFFMSFSSFRTPKYFFLSFIGLPLTGAGLSLLVFGFRREIHKYIKDEGMPVVKEAYYDLKPEIKDLVDTVKGTSNVTEIVCPKCKGIISADSKFCSHCGEKIIK